MSSGKSRNHTPERRSREEMSGSTRAALISAAREIFLRDGFHRASMDQICLNAGVTRGALYHHFGGKTNLLAAVIRQINEETGEAVEQAWLSETDPWQALMRACYASVECALQEDVRRIVLTDGRNELGDLLREWDMQDSLHPFSEALLSLMEGRILPQADPEWLARILNAGLMEIALVVAAAENPREALDRAWATFELMMESLRQRGAHAAG